MRLTVVCRCKLQAVMNVHGKQALARFQDERPLVQWDQFLLQVSTVLPAATGLLASAAQIAIPP